MSQSKCVTKQPSILYWWIATDYAITLLIKKLAPMLPLGRENEGLSGALSQFLKGYHMPHYYYNSPKRSMIDINGSWTDNSIPNTLRSEILPLLSEDMVRCKLAGSEKHVG